jgi:hypothetical protein
VSEIRDNGDAKRPKSLARLIYGPAIFICWADFFAHL